MNYQDLCQKLYLTVPSGFLARPYFLQKINKSLISTWTFFFNNSLHFAVYTCSNPFACQVTILDAACSHNNKAKEFLKLMPTSV